MCPNLPIHLHEIYYFELLCQTFEWLQRYDTASSKLSVLTILLPLTGNLHTAYCYWFNINNWLNTTLWWNTFKTNKNIIKLTHLNVFEKNISSSFLLYLSLIWWWNRAHKMETFVSKYYLNNNFSYKN